MGPTSGTSGTTGVDSSSVKKKLQEANKTVLDAKTRQAEENEYQEFIEEEDTDTSSNAKKAADENKDSSSVQEKDDRVLRYYEQIDSLRQQLDSINQQRRAVVEKMQSGTSISDLENEFVSLNNQTRSINNSINLVFMNIMQLEENIESERLASVSSGAAGVSSVSATGAATGTSAVNSTSGLSSNAKVDTQMGKKLAEAVVSSINANGSTTGWCLRGVNRAMSKVYGYGFSFGSAYQALGALQSDSNFVEITSQYPNKSDLKNLPAGAIVVWGNNSAHPHGHISIALGDGREASDHIANQYTNSGNGYHIFMPKEK